MIRINLLDPKSRRSPLQSKRVVMTVTLAAFSLATAGLLSWHLVLKRRIEEHRDQEVQLQEVKLVLDRIKARIDSNQEKERELKSRATSLRVLNRGRCAPVEVLDTVTCCLPVKQSLSLTSLSHSERRVSFRGSSLEFGSIVDFVQCLEGSAIFNSAKLGRWNGNRGVFDFEILCLLEP